MKANNTQCTPSSTNQNEQSVINQQCSPSEIVDILYTKTQQVWKIIIDQKCIGELVTKYKDQIQRQAGNNNMKACFLLGRSHEKGYGVEQSNQIAIQWYEKARKMGEMHSIYNLTLLKNEIEIKAQLFQEGFQRGQPRCRYQTARKYINQNETSKYGQAQAIIVQLIQYNDIDSHHLAWTLYIKQNWPSHSQQKALQHLKIYKEKVKNTQKWQIFYGYELFEIDRIDQAFNTLMDAYQKYPQDVKKEDGQFQQLIGYYYQRKKQFQKSKQWYKKACERNSLLSILKLANLYFSEQQNEQYSRELLYKAFKAKGNQVNLSIVYHNLGQSYIRTIQPEDAYKFHYEAAKLKDWDSSARCGWLLHQGNGVVQDVKKGRKLVLQAKSYGSSHAQNYIDRVSQQQ